MIYFIKVSLLLVQGISSSIRPFHIHHEIFNLVLESVFGLLQGGTFGIHCLYSLLSIL